MDLLITSYFIVIILTLMSLGIGFTVSETLPVEYKSTNYKNNSKSRKVFLNIYIKHQY